MTEGDGTVRVVICLFERLLKEFIPEQLRVSTIFLLIYKFTNGTRDDVVGTNRHSCLGMAHRPLNERVWGLMLERKSTITKTIELFIEYATAEV